MRNNRRKKNYKNSLRVLCSLAMTDCGGKISHSTSFVNTIPIKSNFRKNKNQKRKLIGHCFWKLLFLQLFILPSSAKIFDSLKVQHREESLYFLPIRWNGFVTKYTCPFCRICWERWKSAREWFTKVPFILFCAPLMSWAKREAAGNHDLCSEQSDQIRQFDFHKVMSCCGCHWNPQLPSSRALCIHVDRRLLPSAKSLTGCPGIKRFSKYLLVLSLHSKLGLGDPKKLLETHKGICRGLLLIFLFGEIAKSKTHTDATRFSVSFLFWNLQSLLH